MNKIIERLLFKFSETYVRHLDERGHKLFPACCDRWLDLLDIVKKRNLIPVICYERANLLTKWLSQAAISVGNNVCFLADSTQKVCQTTNHTRGLNICENYNDCNFISKCRITIENHRCAVSCQKFQRLSVHPTMSFSEKKLYIRDLVDTASRLHIFCGALHDRRKSVQNRRPVPQIPRASNELYDEDSSNDIEVLNPPILRELF